MRYQLRGCVFGRASERNGHFSLHEHRSSALCKTRGSVVAAAFDRRQKVPGGLALPLAVGLSGLHLRELLRRVRGLVGLVVALQNPGPARRALLGFVLRGPPVGRFEVPNVALSGVTEEKRYMIIYESDD